VLNDVFYVICYEDNKVYNSTDGGATWAAKGAKPGAHKSAAAPKDKIAVPPGGELRAVPGKAGHLWYIERKSYFKPGEKADALWRSTDGGATWTPCSNDGLSIGYKIGFGKEAAPGKYPTIFLSGVVSGVAAVYRSTDEGMTWDKIGQNPLGIWGSIKFLDGDKDIFGKVYLAFESGIGFGYGTTNEKTTDMH
jgi:photosystem II stability/assembly factor-like uncharacterized protein